MGGSAQSKCKGVNLSTRSTVENDFWAGKCKRVNLSRPALIGFGPSALYNYQDFITPPLTSHNLVSGGSSSPVSGPPPRRHMRTERKSFLGQNYETQFSFRVFLSVQFFPSSESAIAKEKKKKKKKDEISRGVVGVRAYAHSETFESRY